MLEKYYVGIRPQTNGFHAVHEEGCPFLPETGKRIFLGRFQNPQDALKESRKYFKRSNICLFCSKEYLSQKNTQQEPVFEISENFISSSRLAVTWESALLCSVN